MSTHASLDADTTLGVSPSVYVRPFGDELVLLDFGRGEYFGLDAVGADIWRGIEAGEPLGAIARTLVARYDVTPEVALRDILSLVTHMRDEGLLVTISPADHA